MKHLLTLALLFSCYVSACSAADDGNKNFINSLGVSLQGREDFIVMPNNTNVVQFRIFTNAAPDSPHLFNTFAIEAYGEKLLQTALADASLHNVLVNGMGPDLADTNSMTIIEQTSGLDWCYVGLDITRAYRGRLEKYQRDILFVAPDLFIIRDHVVAKERVNFEMLLHPPSATQLNPVWHDLRLELRQASMRINAPSRRELRKWERLESPADLILSNTVTMKVGPTNSVGQLDLVTVFAVQPSGKKMDYTFKLVESNTAVGARIQRDGLPTLVAFRLDSTNSNPSLDGFKFTGPVGVSVFRPKRNKP